MLMQMHESELEVGMLWKLGLLACQLPPTAVRRLAEAFLARKAAEPASLHCGDKGFGLRFR